MPNRYSHALVVANYENRGLIDPANRPRPADHHPRHPPSSTSSESSTRNQSLGPPQTPAKPQRAAASSLDNAPPAAAALHRPPAPPDNPSPPPPFRARDPTPSPISKERPARAHNRQNSDNGTIVSFTSVSSTSAPAPSVITQIYSPERAVHSPPIPRVVIHDEDPPPPPIPRVVIHHEDPPPTPVATGEPTSPAPTLRRPAPRPAVGRTRSPRLYISEKMSSASSFVLADEPTLDFSCLDDLSVPQQTDVRSAPLKASHRLSLPVSTNTTSSTSPNSFEPASYNLSNIPGKGRGTARPRSLTSTSTQSLAVSDGDDSELYFGSADESSEDSSPSPVSVPTSTESMKRLDSMKHVELIRRLASMKMPGAADNLEAGKLPEDATNLGHISLTPAPPITIPSPPDLNSADLATAPDQSSIRGYSPDDAAPPPIARVRRVNFRSPPEIAAPAPRPRSSSITQRLSSLKSSLFGKTPSSNTTHSSTTPRSPSSSSRPASSSSRPASSSSRPASSSSRPPSSGDPMTSGSMVSGPRGRLILMDKPSKKLEKKAGKELLACSVPYERAKQAKSPIMTTDRNDLMPVGRGWTIGAHGFEESGRDSRAREWGDRQ
ncbi:hypothetical protein MMC26_006342 [Xylographa opegraphella]|nr:hypothetical protein [Xylographa opegraphella]